MGIIASSVIAAVSFVSGCEPAEQASGQLVITFQTDMALPSQIDNVSVQLTRRGGNVLHMQGYSIGGAAHDSPIPGSLVLVAGEEPELITITVAGSRNNVWRTYREVVTTVPRDRVAELRMPIQWLCNESAKPQVMTVPDGKGGQVSRIIQNCDKGFTCKAGECVESETDSATLPVYDPKQLYGGAEKPEFGACFDVLKCMAGGTPVTPTPDCTIERPAGENINVALRVAGGGICNDTTPVTTCFVPLDGEDLEGWLSTDDGRIELPFAVCDRIADRRVLEVLTSTSCKTKLSSLPPCGAWSAVPDDNAIVPMPDPVMPAPPPTWPSPEVFSSLPTEGVSLCCPLLSEGDQLYTCMCTDSKAEATVYAVDMKNARREEFTIDARPSSASSVFNQTLYWSTDSAVAVLPLQAGATPTMFPGKGAHYPNVLLTDSTGVHLLASDLGAPKDAKEGVVQMLHFAYNGEFQGMDPLGSRVVRQFAQDATSFYAIKNADEKLPDGEPFVRMSSVVRIDKATHQVATLLNPQTMTLTDYTHNGFLGVVSDGTDTFALFESEPLAGIEHLQIARVAAASTAAAGDITPIYDLPVSAETHLTSLRLLGAIDGAVIFARDEWASVDRLRSSSLLVIPRGASQARFIADFSGDAIWSGVAASGENVFWLNQSGRIFAVSREALAP